MVKQQHACDQQQTCHRTCCGLEVTHMLVAVICKASCCCCEQHSPKILCACVGVHSAPADATRGASSECGVSVQACRLPPPSRPVASCLMATLWGSCITLQGLFQASALGQSQAQGNAWLQKHVAGPLMQDAATMARIAAELYRQVDDQSQQVSMPEP